MSDFSYVLSPEGRDTLRKVEEEVEGKPWKTVSKSKWRLYYHLLWSDGLDPKDIHESRGTDKDLNRTFSSDLKKYIRKGWVVKMDTGSIDTLLDHLKRQDVGETSSRSNTMFVFPKGVYKAMDVYTRLAREQQVSEPELDQAIDWFQDKVSLGMRAHWPYGYRKLRKKVEKAKLGTRVEKVLILDELASNIHDQLCSSRESSVPGNPGFVMFQIFSRLEKGEP